MVKAIDGILGMDDSVEPDTFELSLETLPEFFLLGHCRKVSPKAMILAPGEMTPLAHVLIPELNAVCSAFLFPRHMDLSQKVLQLWDSWESQGEDGRVVPRAGWP